MSDLGNQHNNGPHQDQIFDNPSALCLALWAKNRMAKGGGVVSGEGGGGGGRGDRCTQQTLYEGSRTVSFFSSFLSN